MHELQQQVLAVGYSNLWDGGDWPRRMGRICHDGAGLRVLAQGRYPRVATAPQGPPPPEECWKWECNLGKQYSVLKLRPAVVLVRFRVNLHFQ